MPKKILIFEDDGAALAFTETLELLGGYDLYITTNNWSDVVYWLDEDPGARNFAAIIFDIDVPTHKLEQYGDRVYDKDKDYSPCRYFIDRFIKAKYKNILDRIILFSAYIDKARPYWPDIYNYKIVNKMEGNQTNNLIQMLNKMR